MPCNLCQRIYGQNAETMKKKPKMSFIKKVCKQTKEKKENMSLSPMKKAHKPRENSKQQSENTKL